MARTETYFPPKFSWGGTPEAPYTNLTFSGALRPNQWLAQLPIMANVPDSRYHAMGLTHLIVNGGQDNSATPPDKRAVMSGGGYLDSIPGNFNDWTDQQILDRVDGEYNQGKAAGFTTTQIMEHLGNNKGVSQTQYRNSGKEQLIQARIQQRLDPIGGRTYGDYDGHFQLDLDGRIAQIRTALGNNANALQLAKDSTPFGNRFYTGNDWQHRHGLIKIYGTGEHNSHYATQRRLIALALDVRARLGAGTTRRVVACGFAGYDETVSGGGHSAIYKRIVPASGQEAISGTFPIWSYVHQIWLGFRALSMDFDYYSWEAEARLGNNPNFVKPLLEPGDLTYFVYNGPNSDRRGVAYNYSATGEFMYPFKPASTEDIIFVFAQMMAFATNYAGFNWTFTSHKVNSTTARPINNDYLVDAYLDLKGECMLFRNGNSNLCTVAFNATGMQTGTTAEIEVPMPSGTPLVFTHFAGVPNLIRVDLNQ